MPNILEIIQQKAKEKASKIAKEYSAGQALSGLEGAKQFDDEQRSAILKIAETDGFKVIMDYERVIMQNCEAVFALDSVSAEMLRNTQIEYSLAKAKYSFLKNLADPGKK